MTDSTLDLLLRNILAAPEDDAARLAYADRCEELGEAERAEFIRVQCELAKHAQIVRLKPGGALYVVPATGGTPTLVVNDETQDIYLGDAHQDVSLLCRRERELLGEKVPGVRLTTGPVSRVIAFLRELPDGLRLQGYQFRRGFVESVACAADDWLAHGDAVLAAQPVLEVRLTTWPDYNWVTRNLPGDLPPGYPFHRRSRITKDALRSRWPRVKAWRLFETDSLVLPDGSHAEVTIS